MTIEAKLVCVNCKADLGPPVRDMAPMCERCAEDRATLSKLTDGWIEERRMQASEGLLVRLCGGNEFVLLSALEILAAIEAKYPSNVGPLLGPFLSLVRREWVRRGPSSKALAAAFQANAQAFVRRHLTSEAAAEVERLRARLVRTEKALNDAETRAAMSAQLAELRFQNLADDVRKAQPN